MILDLAPAHPTGYPLGPDLQPDRADGFGISRATAYRYRDEGIAVLAAQAEDPAHNPAENRLTETTLSVKGKTIDAWHSGKHRDFGANIQAVIRPDGLPVWTSAAMPGHVHNISRARALGDTATLNWAAAELAYRRHATRSR